MENKSATIRFGTFSKDAIPERIAQRILKLIQEKELQPGDKLPAERELATMMGVSRPSLREALRALSILNIIEVRQGDGTYVSSLAVESLLEPLAFIFLLDYSTLLQLFEARKILEVGIVSLAAKKITDEEIQKMEAVLERSIENVDNHEVFLLNDIELHDLIAQAAKNPILHRIMLSLRELGEASRKKTVEIPGVARRTVRDHVAIVSALKARDSQAAELAMLGHLSNVEKRMRNQESVEDHHLSETGSKARP